MSNLITTAQDSLRKQCIEAFVGLQAMAESLAERARENRGQTAAEYMGILLVVAVIIGALIAADVDGKIAKAANTMVDKIAGGNETR